jgi:hypothetical protein
MGTKCTIFIDDLPRMLPTKFWFIWQSGFREKDLIEINQSETRIPLKSLAQMNWNLVGSIYGMSSIKIAHLFPIRWQTWPPQAILVSDWLISKKIVISIKCGGNLLFTGFQNMFFDNNFLFFVTVTATLDDSRRSSIKILKENHICIISIWFDCIWLYRILK